MVTIVLPSSRIEEKERKKSMKEYACEHVRSSMHEGLRSKRMRLFKLILLAMRWKQDEMLSDVFYIKKGYEVNPKSPI